MTTRIYKRGEWYCLDVHFHGRRTRFDASKSKQRAQQFADRLDRIIEAQILGLPLTPDQHEWLRKIAPKITCRLRSIGLAQIELTQIELTAHIKDYEQFLTDKNGVASNRGQTMNALRTIIDLTDAESLSDLTRFKVQRMLAERRSTAKRFSIGTSNLWLQSIKSFLTWCVQERRLDHNPCSLLKRQNVELDRRLVRRTLSEEDFKQFLTATKSGEHHSKMPAINRYWLYAFAATTGFRANECRQLTVSCFELRADRPHVLLPPSASKRKKPDMIWLPAWLANGLQEFLAEKSTNSSAFGIAEVWDLSRAIKIDLAAAGLPYRTEPTPHAPRGEQFDFHALRHQFSTQIAALSLPRDAQQLMRVSDLALVTRYAHPEDQRMRDAINKMPDLSLD